MAIDDYEHPDVYEPCCRCGKDSYVYNAQTRKGGYIYIRVERKGKWTNAPICRACWNKENPDRPIKET